MFFYPVILITAIIRFSVATTAVHATKAKLTDIPPVSFEIGQRSLQSCESSLESIVRERHEGNGVDHSCSCESSTATCKSVFPETCGSADCSIVDCVDVNSTFVDYCVESILTTIFKIETLGTVGFNRWKASSTSSTFVHFFKSGVDNVCYQSVGYTFSDDSDFASGCSMSFDGEACKTCAICDPGSLTNAGVTRSIDCSNIDADAVDTDCVPETDYVDAQLLKFKASAVCEKSGSPKSQLTISIGFLAAMVSAFLASFW